MSGRKRASLLVWVVVFTITLSTFYLMNRVVMSMQGLPLAADLRPRQAQPETNP